MTHFSTRARERAGVSDPDTLFHDLLIALSHHEKWSDYIEHVKDIGDGKAYRVRTHEGIFYVIAKSARPVTVYTQEQMARKKWAVKARRAKRDPDAALLHRRVMK